MANLRDISRRMASIQSTMQVTRTMEMISTARIRKALDRAEEASPYKDAITRMLANVASSDASIAHPLLTKHPVVKSVLFVVIASDRGLAGGFNVVPQRLVEREMRDLAKRGIESGIITCGRKPTEYFTSRKIIPKMSFVGISSEPNMDEAERIASYVMDGYISGMVDRVELLYWHAKSRVDQQFVRETLLPISREELMMPNEPREREALSKVNRETHTEFTFEPSAGKVLGELLPAYVRTVVFHALLDSAAAEHGARRRAMQSATDSAEEVLNQLSRTYNRVRQGSITTELNEIIGGASALEDSN
ncbi:MAG: ATP synthase F1 subunit gamma [Atopobiaceae bacterium]|nr:ATP synthase F1 subunit gamma [Atopobiaceae bacterium]